MKLIALVFLSIFSTATLGASWQITYPRPLTDADPRTDYPIKLLSLALDQTGVNYRLVPSKKVMPQSKALQRLEDNREVNIVWTGTSKSREQHLLPIRIPIYKGLIGWRLFLIRSDMKARFEYVQKFEHLIKLAPVQQRDWPDTKILQANGFDVATSNTYPELFDMIRTARADFFPRSVVEIWSELDSQELSNGLIVEPTIGVRYPTALYYFVNKKSVPLAHLIKTGLERAIENGKFDELFHRVHQPLLNKAKLGERRFFELENTFLPELTPIDRPELWYQPVK